MRKIQLIEGIQTEAGDRYLLVGSGRGSVWIPLADLFENAPAVFAKIAKATGEYALSPQARSEFIKRISAFSRFKDGTVVERYGWNGRGSFAHLDREISAVPKAPPPSMIVSDIRFAPAGTLELWHRALTPFASRSKLAIFAVGLALTGPLLRHLPATVPNVLCEFWGPSQSGKTTLAIVAQSVWAGDPEGNLGAASSWNVTPGAIEDLRARYNDTLLVLDEAESLADRRQREDFVMGVVMSGSASRGRGRQGQSVGPSLRGAILSTSNSALADILGVKTPVARDAALSRVISVQVGSDIGSVPALERPRGGSTVERDIRALRMSVSSVYGVAGRHYVAYLTAKLNADSDAFKVELQTLHASYRDRLNDLEIEARKKDMAAAICVALRLARRAGTIPRQWGKPASIVRAVLAKSEPSRPAHRAREKLVSFAVAHIDNVSLPERVGPETKILLDAESSAGPWLVFASAWLNKSFDNARSTLQILRAADLIRTDQRGDASPRLDFKPRKPWIAMGAKLVVPLKLTDEQVARIERSLRSR